MGFSDLGIMKSTSASYLSRRFSRECLLGAAKDGTCGLVYTSTFILSELASTSCTPSVHFTVSVCEAFVLLSEGCIVYLYKIDDAKMSFVASVICPHRVLAVSMDTSAGRHAIAMLVDGRMGIVADITYRNRAMVSPRRRNTYTNICSEDDPPRSVAICPQRACVAFGCQGGIELHWVDALTGQDLSRWFPLSTPSDFLYFLPQRRGVDSVKKLRLISSAVHPEEASPLGRRFGMKTGGFAHWVAWEPGLFGTAQSDHYMAVPIGDGVNVMFTDPEDGSVYLGGDAPVSEVYFTFLEWADQLFGQLGGPTKLLRRIRLVPPSDPPQSTVTDYMSEVKDSAQRSPESLWIRLKDNIHDETATTIVGKKMHETGTCLTIPPRPRVYAAGKYLQYGVRIAVGYQDWLVFYTIPPDVYNIDMGRAKYGTTIRFNPMRVEAEKPIEIMGCHVAYIPGLVDVAVDSGPAMAVWAFTSAGEARVYRLFGTFEERSMGTEIVMKRGEIVSLDGPSPLVRQQYDDGNEEGGFETLLGGRADGEDETGSDATWGSGLLESPWECPSVMNIYPCSSISSTGDSSDDKGGKVGTGFVETRLDGKEKEEEAQRDIEWNVVIPWPLDGDALVVGSEGVGEAWGVDTGAVDGIGIGQAGRQKGNRRGGVVRESERWVTGMNEGILELMEEDEDP